MPDVVDVIKAQHRVVDSLLTEAEAEGADVKAIMQKVAALLKPHSEAEESFVYPAIRQKQASETEMVKDGVAEHHHLEGMLDELLTEDSEGPGYDGKLAALIGELRHHVEEEEQDLLPVLSRKAGEKRHGNAIARNVPEALQAAIMASPSATVVAIGFSQRMARTSAAAAFSTRPRWLMFSLPIMTPSRFWASRSSMF